MALIEAFKTETIVINGTNFGEIKQFKCHLIVHFSGLVIYIMTPVSVRPWNLVFFSKTQRKFSQSAGDASYGDDDFDEEFEDDFEEVEDLGTVIFGPSFPPNKKNGPSWVVGLWLCFSFFLFWVFPLLFFCSYLLYLNFSWNSGRFKNNTFLNFWDFSIHPKS